MKPHLPFDVARCQGVAYDTGELCPLRESCLRYLAEWGKYCQTYLIQPAGRQGDACNYYLPDQQGNP